MDTLALADDLAAQLTDTRGLSAVPVNRTMAAMRELGLYSVSNSADAGKLMHALGVDAVLVPSLTAWQPYEPPAIGLTLALYEARPAPTLAPHLAPERLSSGYTDGTTDFGSAGTPAQALTIHLDAANHDTLMRVRDYATGRHDPNLALGWRRYVVSMPLYQKFAVFETVQQLMDRERLRLAADRLREHTP